MRGKEPNERYTDEECLNLWIAAHALATGLTLVTNNASEVRRVRGLKVRNWAA